MNSPNQFFLLQAALLFLSLSSSPSEAILIKSIPVLRRFTASSIIYALSRAVIYLTTSFSLVYMTNGLGDYGLLISMLPITAGFLWGVRHFEGLEKPKENNFIPKEGQGSDGIAKRRLRYQSTKPSRFCRMCCTSSAPGKVSLHKP